CRGWGHSLPFCAPPTATDRSSGGANKPLSRGLSCAPLASPRGNPNLWIDAILRFGQYAAARKRGLKSMPIGEFGKAPPLASGGSPALTTPMYWMYEMAQAS